MVYGLSTVCCVIAQTLPPPARSPARAGHHELASARDVLRDVVERALENNARSRGSRRNDLMRRVIVVIVRVSALAVRSVPSSAPGARQEDRFATGFARPSRVQLDGHRALRGLVGKGASPRLPRSRPCPLRAQTFSEARDPGPIRRAQRRCRGKRAPRSTPRSHQVVLAITLDREDVPVGILEPGDFAAPGAG
jgi:hypothetical protein